MSRRRRHALKSAARARSTWDKTLRRRARGARSAGAASVTAVAAVTLASVTTAFATPSTQDATRAAQSADVTLAECQSPPAPSSAPRALAVLDDTLFFTANDGTHGRELWKSDGTEDGTVLVKNINPNDSARGAGSSPEHATVLDGQIFFSANDGTRGTELWKSDGTRAGTVLVKNIAPTGSGAPQDLTTMGSRVFFTADDGNSSRELWRSNGTREGTVLVKNIAPESADYPGSYPGWLTVIGRRLFFSADDGTHGSELWRTDGSRVGTVLLKDVDPISRDDDPDYPGSNPGWLTRMGGQLFFAANDGSHGYELWTSDGSRVGTVLVKDINGRWRDSWPGSLTVMGDRLFFSADDGTHGDELWRSDGSRAGTVLVKDINPDLDSYYNGSDPTALTAAGNQLFFAAGTGTSGEQLWHSDGSRAGTAVVRTFDITGPYDGHGYGYSASLTPLAGRIYFGADEGVHGDELWASDGTDVGTGLVEDINPCNADVGDRSRLRPSAITAVGDRVFFAVNDDIHGEELWVSDGTPEGTVLVKDIRGGTP